MPVLAPPSRLVPRSRVAGLATTKLTKLLTVPPDVNVWTAPFPLNVTVDVSALVVLPARVPAV